MIRGLRRRFGLAASLVLFVLAIMVGALLLAGLAVVGLQLLGGVHFWRTERGADAGAPLLGLAGVVAFAIVMGTALAAFFSRKAMRPIRHVIDAMRDVARGDFGMRVDLKGIPELEDLSNSFNTMAAELAATETLRRDFVNDFSHEFRTPIQSLRGYAKLLQNPGLTEAERADYLRIVIEEAEHLSSLSSGILQLSAYENTGIVTGKADYRLDEQIRRAVVLLQPTWAAKSINVIVDLDDAAYVGNEDVTEQIWRNLLDNACKFTKPGGTIRVGLTRDGGQFRVTVQDDGIAMDEETVSHVFERFYQADRSRAQVGNGLGLAIVQRAVQLCGGSIKVESRPGKGSRFTVVLPAATDEGQP